MMKRSRRTTLLLATTALVLVACDDPQEEIGAFESVGQCVDAGNARDDCERADNEARTAHSQVAPKFASKEDCEEDFGPGKCETAPPVPNSGQSDRQHGSGFMPMYMGYMMGRSGSGSSVVSQPLYRAWDRDAGKPGSFRTAESVEVARAPGYASVGKSVASARPAVTTATVSRGGFGARGASISAGS